jgi:exopolyphosphatase/guanosine-5'-triphosphate,3'-diphosphate pyrophosphatase
VGFDEREIATMATIALFHRKSRPGARHEVFSDLDPASRARVRLLSALLRLAEYLDRGHAGAVAHVTLRREGSKALVLEVEPASDWHLERWRLENRRDTLEKALGRSLTVREVTGA